MAPVQLGGTRTGRNPGTASRWLPLHARFSSLHSIGALDPPGQNVPCPHGAHPARAGVDTVPTGQAVHALSCWAPAAVENWPARQRVHVASSEAPVRVEKEPASHAWHPSVPLHPLWRMCVPAAQSRHAEARLAGWKVPLGHISHTVWPDSEANHPAEQGWHDDAWDALPWSFPHVPGWQAVHRADAGELWWVPAAQSAHRVSPVVEANWPASHRVQAVAPVSMLYAPVGQAVQFSG